MKETTPLLIAHAIHSLKSLTAIAFESLDETHNTNMLVKATVDLAMPRRCALIERYHSDLMVTQVPKIGTDPCVCKQHIVRRIWNALCAMHFQPKELACGPGLDHCDTGGRDWLDMDLNKLEILSLMPEEQAPYATVDGFFTEIIQDPSLSSNLRELRICTSSLLSDFVASLKKQPKFVLSQLQMLYLFEVHYVSSSDIRSVLDRTPRLKDIKLRDVEFEDAVEDPN